MKKKIIIKKTNKIIKKINKSAPVFTVPVKDEGFPLTNF